MAPKTPRKTSLIWRKSKPLGPWGSRADAPSISGSPGRSSFASGIESNIFQIRGGKKPGQRGVGRDRRWWRSNPSGKCSRDRLTRGTATSTLCGAAHSSGCARCGAGAGCSAMKYQSFKFCLRKSAIAKHTFGTETLVQKGNLNCRSGSPDLLRQS
jgi:hypothetical protein